MSDLAVVDIDTTAAEVTTRSYALVGQFDNSNDRTDATLSALLRNLPGKPATIASTSTPSSDVDTDFVDVRDNRATIRAIGGVETIIVVSPVFGADLKSAMHLSRIALRAKLHGQVVAFVNAAVQPTNNALTGFFVRNAIRNADLTILRDEKSADVLLDVGIEGPLRIGADPAWSELGDLFAAPVQQDRVVVAMNDEVIDVDFLSELLAPVADSGLEVLLQPWQGSHDVGPVAERVGSNVTVIDRPGSLREARDLYSTSRGVLALRSHALMAAASAGAPTVVLGDPGFRRFAGSLGVPSAPNGVAPTEAAKVFMETLENGIVGSRAVPQIIDRAKATVDLVRLLLTEGEDLTQSANNPLPLYPQPWR